MINYLAQHWNLINFIQQQIKRLITYNQTLANADFFVECCPKGLQRLYQKLSSMKILRQLHDQQLLIVSSTARNALILYKGCHAEFVEPGSAVGGPFDLDCKRVLPVGRLSLKPPESAEEQRKAILIRRQWVRLIMQIRDNPVPLQRAQKILNLLENYFDQETINQLPDEALALLVDVSPHMIKRVRNQDDSLE
jgi:hypothetical protein